MVLTNQSALLYKISSLFVTRAIVELVIEQLHEKTEI